MVQGLSVEWKFRCNQMEKKKEDEMEAGIMKGFSGRIAG